MIGWHNWGATRAQTVCAEYQLLQSCSFSFTQWVRVMLGEAEFVSKNAPETGIG